MSRSWYTRSALASAIAMFAGNCDSDLMGDIILSATIRNEISVCGVSPPPGPSTSRVPPQRISTSTIPPNTSLSGEVRVA
jgi:hypothetical protein